MTRYFIIFLVTMLTSCVPKIGSNIIVKQNSLLNSETVLVLQKEDIFNNDGIEIGVLNSSDNGFSSNCSYENIIAIFIAMARTNGANIVKISERKTPDVISNCDRITATLFKVPDIKKHEVEIEWSKTRKLTWNDFKAKPELSSKDCIAATTYCGFGFETNKVTLFDKVKLKTRNVFECYRSWVRPESTSNSLVLEHEQLHFDLSEVYARLLRKKIDEKKYSSLSLVKNSNLVFKEVFSQFLRRQELYDIETDHGRDLLKQKMWQKTIENELLELDNYNKID